MTRPIVEMKLGVPKNDREWNQLFSKLQKHLRVLGDSLILQPDVTLPNGTIKTDQIEDDNVTNEKLRESVALSLIGRASNSVGNPADISATVPDTFMVRRGSALTFDALEDGDIPLTIARDAEVTAAISAHAALSDPHPGYLTPAEGNAAYQQLGAIPILPTYAVAGVPSAATYARGLIYVSDETGGAVPAFSDGTNWRRVTDRAVVA